MLHGNPTWCYYYRHVVGALRERYRCIVPDHLGCGLSDKPSLSEYDYSLKRRIDDLESLLDQLNIGNKVTLILHDWGGMIGLGWATRHPERVERLILLNTAGFPLPAGKRLPWALWLGRNTLLGKWLIRGMNAFCLAACETAVCIRRLTSRDRRAYLSPYDSWDHRVAVWRFVQSIPLREGDEGFEIVNEVARGLTRFREIPALICWGMKDFVFDHHFLEEWENRLPAAKVLRFSRAGHYILEDEREAVIDAIQQFLP
jgi:haloalkane dehalogenase